MTASRVPTSAVANHALEASGVSKSFGGVCANTDVSLTIDSGETLGLIGPNGSGKSTFLNLVAGFHRADAGTISWSGREIQILPAHRIARLGIARTFQDFRLFLDLSTIENVMVGSLLHRASVPSARAEARGILESVELSAKEMAPANSLSTGQRKRLELARCLALRPKLLLLDEPLAGVDPGNRPGVIKLLSDLVREKQLAVLLVEHDPDVVRQICTRVIAFDQGRVLIEGPPKEVYDSELLRHAYMEG